MEAETRCLKLNRSKEKLIYTNLSIQGIVIFAFSGVQKVDLESTTVLGLPLGDMHSMDLCTCPKIDMLKSLHGMLCYLQPHDAITLLHHSLAILNLLHILWTLPIFGSSWLLKHDCNLKSHLNWITCLHCPDDDPALLNATLTESNILLHHNPHSLLMVWLPMISIVVDIVILKMFLFIKS